MMKSMKVPFDREELSNLRAGDTVTLSGTILVARDAAHKRFFETLQRGEELPVLLEGETIYYMGPTPARPGKVAGSAGPTTAGRMDKYTPELLDLGLCAMIGKGRRSEEVYKAIERNNAVYFAAVGGAGAYLSKCIKASEVVAYEDLGPEAVRRLTVDEFPVIVVADAAGGRVY